MSAAIIAGVVVTGGSIIAADKAADTQADATAASTATSEAALDFQMTQYEDQMAEIAELESIFGPIRENLDTYYQDMSVEQIELRGRTEIEKQYERSNQNIDAVFSNNGMYNSGQRASAQVALEASREETLGRNLQNAESTFQNEQMNWLGVGLQEKNSARGLAASTQGLIGQSYNNLSNTQMQGGIGAVNTGMTIAQGYGDLGSGLIGAGSYLNQAPAWDDDSWADQTNFGS